MEQANQVGAIYKDFRNILDVVSRGIWALIKYAQGNCVYFTTRKVLKYAGCEYGPEDVLAFIEKEVE